MSFIQKSKILQNDCELQYTQDIQIVGKEVRKADKYRSNSSIERRKVFSFSDYNSKLDEEVRNLKQNLHMINILLDGDISISMLNCDVHSYYHSLNQNKQNLSNSDLFAN